MVMTSYFFDTNFLFKNFFNRKYFRQCELKDYFNSDCEKFISKNVEYEFSNIFLEFSNQMSQFLAEPYFEMDNQKTDISLKQYQKLTKDIEILKFNNSAVSSMIWKSIYPRENTVKTKRFKNDLNDFIWGFNTYFHYKYKDLMSQFKIHNRLAKYEEINLILGEYLHKADLNICLDAHDLCVCLDIDDLVFVSSDKDFKKNEELILENTKIKEVKLLQ